LSSGDPLAVDEVECGVHIRMKVLRRKRERGEQRREKSWSI
jgi:hypothetical protein